MANGAAPAPEPAVPAQDWSQYGTVQGPPDWSQYGVVRTPSAAKDIALSLGTGAVEGAMATAAAPGEMAELAQKGAQMFGVKPPTPGELAGRPPGSDVRLPRYNDIHSAIEEWAGPFYKSETGLGQAARAIGQEIPQSLVGRNPVANLVRYGMIPGLASELSGQLPGVKGTDIEPYVRAATSILAAGVGGVGARPATAERVLGTRLPGYVTPQHVQQAQDLIDQAGQRGVTLTWSEALSQVTGRQVLLDMQRILESSRRSAPAMEEALGGRAREVYTAGQGELQQIGPAIPYPAVIGPQAGRAAEDTLTDARQAINRATQSSYDTASRVMLTPVEMAQVRAIPGYQQAARTVRGDPQLNRNVAHLPENSIGFLNEVKKYFDQQAENTRSPVQQGRSQQRSAGFSQSAATARQVGIDAGERHAIATGGPNHYEVALNTQEQTRRRYLEPLMQGPLGKLAESDLTTQRAIEALFPKSPLAGSEDQVRDAVTALSRRNPVAAQALVRAHLEMELENAFTAAGRTPQGAGFAGATFAQSVAGSPAITSQRLQNLRAAVESLPNGQTIWPGFERFLEVMRATGWRQPIGSRTAFNVAELHSLETGNIGNVLKEAASPERWLNLVHEYWGRWQAGRNLDRLAAIITDPRSGPIFERLARTQRGADTTGLLIRLGIIGETAGRGTPAPVQQPAQQ